MKPRRPLVLLTAATAVLALTLGGAVTPAAAGERHGAVVAPAPRSPKARVIDGTVTAGDRVGDLLVVGGTFTRIELPDGSTVAQRYLAAFDARTGAFVDTFRPVLDGAVKAVEAGDGATVFVGGEFTTVTGASATRLVKLRTPDGSVDTTFRAGANARVTALDRLGTKLYVGGDFTTIRGVARSRLAQVATTNGGVSSALTVGITGRRDSGYRGDGFFRAAGGAIVRSVRVSPDGARLVVAHRGDLVGGQQRWGVAVLDVSGTATVTPWRTRLWEQTSWFGRPDFVGIQDADLSPDGSTFVVASDIGNFPPLHDTVIAFPVSGTSLTNANVQPLWVTQNFDSTYSVAITDAAVYMGGHFCWTESQSSPVGPLAWPGRSGNQYSCEETGGGVFQPQVVARRGIAAVDLPTGRALDWNPGSRSFQGVLLLRAVRGGLLVGQDGDWLGGRRTGRSGFFPTP